MKCCQASQTSPSDRNIKVFLWLCRVINLAAAIRFARDSHFMYWSLSLFIFKQFVCRHSEIMHPQLDITVWLSISEFFFFFPQQWWSYDLHDDLLLSCPHYKLLLVCFTAPRKEHLNRTVERNKTHQLVNFGSDSPFVCFVVVVLCEWFITKMFPF